MPWRRTVWRRREAAFFDEGVPGGKSGAGKCGGFIVAEVGGCEGEGLLGEYEVFGEGARDYVAEAVKRFLGGGGAVDPTGAVVGDDAVAYLEARCIGAEGDDLADGIGDLGHGELEVRIVVAVVEKLVTVVERDGGDADESFPGAGLWVREYR